MQTKLDLIEAALGPFAELVKRFNGNCRMIADFCNQELPRLRLSERACRHYKNNYWAYKSGVTEPGLAVKGTDRWLYNEMRKAIWDVRKGLTVAPFTRKPTRDKEDLAVILSDLHFGKRVEQGGRVIYDIGKAKRNFERLTENVRHLTENYIKPLHKLDELVLFMCGDMVDGELVYYQQTWNLEFPVRQQLKMALETMMPLITWGSETFEAVRIYSVFGNHGTDDRMHQTSNWDLLLYDMIDLASQPLDNVVSYISEDAFNLAQVRGHRYLLRHKIPQQLKTAIGRARAAGWWEQHRYDVMLTGHWHNFGLDNFNSKYPVFYNGNLFASDDLTEWLSYGVGRPTQWMFGISDKRPTTLLWPVTLD